MNGSKIDDALPVNTVKTSCRELKEGRLDLITNELSEIIEYRKGRKIHQRTITLSPSFITSNKDTENNLRRASTLIQILYVHGLCAGSFQYNSLVDAIGNQLLQQQTDVENNMLLGIQNTLFDALGFGGSSSHDPLDWNAYSEEESAKDLKYIFQCLAHKGPTYIIAHSYGVSQVLRLICELSSSNNNNKTSLDNLSGIICLSGAIMGGVKPDICINRGLPIFGLPVFALKLLQPELSAKFVQQAYYPSSPTKLKDSAWEYHSNSNMNIIKAYHRQTNWATIYDAALVMVKSLVIHGEDDLVVPLQCGKHLATSLINSNFVVVPETRHQVFEEKPEFVAKKIIAFIEADLVVE